MERGDSSLPSEDLFEDFTLRRLLCSDWSGSLESRETNMVENPYTVEGCWRLPAIVCHRCTLQTYQSLSVYATYLVNHWKNIEMFVCEIGSFEHLNYAWFLIGHEDKLVLNQAYLILIKFFRCVNSLVKCGRIWYVDQMVTHKWGKAKRCDRMIWDVKLASLKFWIRTTVGAIGVCGF